MKLHGPVNSMVLSQRPTGLVAVYTRCNVSPGSRAVSFAILNAVMVGGGPDVLGGSQFSWTVLESSPWVGSDT